MSSTNRPLIVSILSGKGGVGKSILALNLAERCADLGLRTLAVDLSSSGGNLHILANCANGVGVEQYLEKSTTLSRAVTSIAPTCDLLCRADSGPINALEDSSALKQICDNLRKDAAQYDLVVIDHGSGMSSLSTVTALHSDISLLLVVPELTSIADCYGLFKYLTEHDRKADCRLVVNRAKSENDAHYLAEKLTAMAETFLRLTPKLAGWISEDKAVSESVAKQRPVAMIGRQAIAVEQVGRIAQLLKNELSSRQTGLGVYDPDLPGGRVNPQTTINNNPATADIKG